MRSAFDAVTNHWHGVAREARTRGHDEVVCGHIHRAEMREIVGTLYCNDGDWLETRTDCRETVHAVKPRIER